MQKRLVVFFLSFILIVSISFSLVSANIFTDGITGHVTNEFNSGITIVSDENTLANGVPSVPSFNISSWTANISGATWIWSEYKVSHPLENTTVTFTRDFTLTQQESIGAATLIAAADNNYTCSLNGQFVGGSNNEKNFRLGEEGTYSLDGKLVAGTNTLTCDVKNWAHEGATPEGNPAGLLYRIDILYTQSDGDGGIVNGCNLINTQNKEAINTYLTDLLKSEGSFALNTKEKVQLQPPQNPGGNDYYTSPGYVILSGSNGKGYLLRLDEVDKAEHQAVFTNVLTGQVLVATDTLSLDSLSYGVDYDYYSGLAIVLDYPQTADDKILSFGDCFFKIANPLECSDSDGGKDYYTKGSDINELGTTYEDVCIDGNNLKELFCTPNPEEGLLPKDFSMLDSVFYGCPYGCVNGACVQQSQCTETSESREIQELEQQSVNDLEIGVITADENNLILTATLRVYNFSDGSYFSLSLSSDNPVKTISSFGDRTYKIELISTTDTSATIRVTLLCGIVPVPSPVCDNGCSLNGKCYPYGYRVNNSFCSADSGQFVVQLEKGVECNNHFECGSNLCVQNQCVSQNLIQRIVEWVRNIFGLD